jgi:hypothetical protein
MKLAALLPFLALLSGCPSPGGFDAGVNPNPPELWLAPNGSELALRLTPVKPVPY